MKKKAAHQAAFSFPSLTLLMASIMAVRTPGVVIPCAFPPSKYAAMSFSVVALIMCVSVNTLRTYCNPKAKKGKETFGLHKRVVLFSGSRVKPGMTTASGGHVECLLFCTDARVRMQR